MAAQAKSYANIIDNIRLDDFFTEFETSPRVWLDETYYQVDNPLYYAVLADISGDGVPILILFCEIPFADQGIEELEDFGEHLAFMLIYHLDGDNATIFRNSMNDSEGGFKAISIATYENRLFLYGFTAYSDVSSDYSYLIRAANGTLGYVHSVTHEVLFELPDDPNDGWNKNNSVYTRNVIDGKVVDWSSIEAIRDTERSIFTEYNSGGFSYGEEFPGRSKTQRNLVTTALKNYASDNAAPPITITLDGRLIESEVPPIIENGRTLVPLRAIFEAMGATVDWDEPTQTVTASRGERIITLTIGDPRAKINGEDYTLDVPPKTVNGRTLVPVRFVAESFGAAVNWIEQSQAVIITDQK